MEEEEPRQDLLKEWGFHNDHCFFCGKHNSEIRGLLMQCGKCKDAYYCSTKCFNKDLPRHTEWCTSGKLQRDPRGYVGGVPATKKEEEKEKLNFDDDEKSRPKKNNKKSTGTGTTKETIGKKSSVEKGKKNKDDGKKLKKVKKTKKRSKEENDNTAEKVEMNYETKETQDKVNTVTKNDIDPTVNNSNIAGKNNDKDNTEESDESNERNSGVNLLPDDKDTKQHLKMGTSLELDEEDDETSRRRNGGGDIINQKDINTRRVNMATPSLTPLEEKDEESRKALRKTDVEKHTYDSDDPDWANSKLRQTSNDGQDDEAICLQRAGKNNNENDDDDSETIRLRRTGIGGQVNNEKEDPETVRLRNSIQQGAKNEEESPDTVRLRRVHHDNNTAREDDEDLENVRLRRIAGNEKVEDDPENGRLQRLHQDAGKQEDEDSETVRLRRVAQNCNNDEEEDPETARLRRVAHSHNDDEDEDPETVRLRRVAQGLDSVEDEDPETVRLRHVAQGLDSVEDEDPEMVRLRRAASGDVDNEGSESRRRVVGKLQNETIEKDKEKVRLRSINGSLSNINGSNHQDNPSLRHSEIHGHKIEWEKPEWAQKKALRKVQRDDLYPNNNKQNNNEYDDVEDDYYEQPLSDGSGNKTQAIGNETDGNNTNNNEHGTNNKKGYTRKLQPTSGPGLRVPSCEDRNVSLKSAHIQQGKKQFTWAKPEWAKRPLRKIRKENSIQNLSNSNKDLNYSASNLKLDDSMSSMSYVGGDDNSKNGGSGEHSKSRLEDSVGSTLECTVGDDTKNLDKSISNECTVVQHVNPRSTISRATSVRLPNDTKQPIVQRSFVRSASVRHTETLNNSNTNHKSSVPEWARRPLLRKTERGNKIRSNN